MINKQRQDLIYSNLFTQKTHLSYYTEKDYAKDYWMEIRYQKNKNDY